MIRPDTSDLWATSLQPTLLTFKGLGLWGFGELWGVVLPGGMPGRAFREKTPVVVLGGGRLIIAGLSSGRTCSTGVRAWASTVESWGHMWAGVQLAPLLSSPTCSLLPAQSGLVPGA